MAFLLVGSFALAVAWTILFWVASLVIYLVACGLSVFNIYCDIKGDRNICWLFFVVTGLSVWVYSLEGSNFGYATFVFLTGSFFLFKSADIWKIGTC